MQKVVPPWVEINEQMQLIREQLLTRLSKSRELRIRACETVARSQHTRFEAQEARERAQELLDKLRAGGL